MKKRIEKFIKEYKLNISRTEEKIKELEKEIMSERIKMRGEITQENLELAANCIATLQKKLAIQDKKRMILVQAVSDFECLLPHASKPTI